jgi:hypothetical protein
MLLTKKASARRIWSGKVPRTSADTQEAVISNSLILIATLSKQKVRCTWLA